MIKELPSKAIGFLKSLSRKCTDAPLSLKQQAKRERRRAWIAEHRYLLLCMLLPALVMYLIYFVRGIHPIGDSSVLVLDLTGQYAWFFEGLRNTVWGDASMLYTYARALGGEFLGIFAYYIASPLSYIVCLFPQDRMLEALLTLFLIKVAISGGTFGYYMHRTLKERRPLAVITFSIFYALSAYAVVQQHNTMWIDALMWLPLLTLGMEALIKHGKFKMYTIFLALTVFSNFYIGYMVCFYCFIYFFVYYFAHAENNRNNPIHESLHFVKSLLRILFYSVLAIAMTAVVILGAYYALNFGKTTFSETAWEWTTNFDILDLLYKFLPGSYDTVRPEGLPFLYCGVLTLLFIPTYFLSQKYPMRQKIMSGVFIFLLVAIMSLNVTDLIMHGFQAPNWLNYRYSFMLCFYLCVIACRAFADFEAISLRVTLGTGGLISLMVVIIQKYDGIPHEDPNDYMAIWFSLIVIFAQLAALGCLRSSNKKRLAAIGMLVVVCMEAFLAGLLHICALDMDVGYTRYSYYNDFLSRVRPIVETVQEQDNSFYRMEKTVFFSTNDNMSLEMRGLSGSTSTLNAETVQFLAKMGYSSRSHWSKYLGGNPVNDSLLGVKYVVSDSDVQSHYYQTVATDTANGLTAYQNPYALSIAYGVDGKILEFPLGFTNIAPEEVTTVQTDEEAVKVDAVGSLFGSIKSRLNEWFEIDEMQSFSKYVDEHSTPFERLNAIIGAMLGKDGSEAVFKPISLLSQQTYNLSTARVQNHTRYGTNDPDIGGVLRYNIQATQDGEIYFYLPSDYPREVKLTLLTDSTGEEEIEMGTFNGNETTRIISLGYHQAGTTLTLKMTLMDKYLYVMDHVAPFYYIDYPVFEAAIEALSHDQLIVTDFDEDEIHGNFTASRQNETVLTTLPYDKGWKIYVDGEQVEITKALGALISFQINGEAGQTHEISMIYRPNTYVIGLTVSLVSGAILLAIILLEKKIKKVPVLRALVTATPGAKVVESLAEQEIPAESHQDDIAIADNSPTDNQNSLE